MKTIKTFWRKRYIEFTPMVISGMTGHGPVARTCDYFTVEDIAKGHAGTRDEEYTVVTEIVSPLSPEAAAGLIAAGNESLRRVDEEAQRKTDEAEFARLAEKLGREV